MKPLVGYSPPQSRMITGEVPGTHRRSRCPKWRTKWHSLRLSWSRKSMEKIYGKSMEMLGESGKSMEKCRMFGWFWRICVWIWRIFWWWRMIKLDDFGGFLMVLDGWFLDMFGWILGLRLWLDIIKTLSQRDVMRMISLCQLYRQRYGTDGTLQARTVHHCHKGFGVSHITAHVWILHR